LPSSRVERFGLDSNILVYAQDDREPQRQARARLLVERAAGSGRCVLSTQNLGEFFNVVTRKIKRDPLSAQQRVRELMTFFQIVSPTVDDITLAMAARAEGRFQFWDAHLLATLGRAGCSVLLSEDMADGARLGALTVRNPFGGTELPDDLAQLLAR
jgi:predicted nucleic acid-binding protein